MNNLYTIGTAYYPDYVQFQAYNIETDMGETVDSYERIRQDFARMKKVGIQEIRIGEFSWSTVEQKEGDYTPDLFLHTLDLAELHKHLSDILYSNSNTSKMANRQISRNPTSSTK